MINPVKAYTHWLHTRWPAGTVEKLPLAKEDGSTNVPGLYITGDLTGVPLLKFSAHTGARAVQAIMASPSFPGRSKAEDVIDIAIVGGGVSGFSAAIEAKKAGLSFKLFEASEAFSTIVNFPKGKPIFTYPTDMTPAGDLQFHDKSDVKEGLLEDMWDQVREAGIEPTIARVEQVNRKGKLFELPVADGESVKAHRVIVAIGRSGNFRKLDIPGEDKDKVYNRLHDPKDFCGQDILVVGGGDSAMETAIALASCGSNVTLSYRKPEFSRPKPENVEKINALAANPGAVSDVESVDGDRVTTPSGEFLHPDGGGSLTLMMASKPKEIRDDAVVVTDSDGNDQTLKNDAVFEMIGREPPLDFFRRSGVRISGEWSPAAWAGLIVFMLFCIWIYHWKADYNIPFGLQSAFNGSYLGVVPGDMWAWLKDAPQNYFATEGTLGHTLAISTSGRSFYYTFLYAACVVIFGIRRMRRRRTPYVKLQTYSLMAIQVLPLFLLPEIIFPWMGHNGWFNAGIGAWFADTFFPVADYGHGREYWRAYGFILAWPLMAWNWFTNDPLWGWLILGFLQTFVAIPAMIYFWGKGAYCGWICSCGALAETLGDAHRHKMPHGPFWNRVNMVGQVFLLFAVVIMGLRIVSWVTEPEQAPASVYVAQGWYDEAAGTTKSGLYNVPTDDLQGVRFITVPGVDEPIQVESVATTTNEWGGTDLVLAGNVVDSLGDKGLEGTAVWEQPGAVYASSSFLFNYLAKGDGLPILNFAYMVDLMWAGILGVGLYFHFSGRVWCRFACPLAALMHIYTKFSRFGIVTDKKKCISCNVCTSVCHQGIDIMNFANKGLPMQDVECVRCSACVQSCPTGVLTFGQVDREGNTMKTDPAWLAASPVQMAELTINGKSR